MKKNLPSPTGIFVGLLIALAISLVIARLLPHPAALATAWALLIHATLEAIMYVPALRSAILGMASRLPIVRRLVSVDWT